VIGTNCTERRVSTVRCSRRRADTVPKIGMSDFRADLSTAVARVAFGGEPLIIQRSGKDFAAVVPLEALELLEKLEDRLLIEAAEEAEAQAASKGEKPVPWHEVRDELGG